jgi:Sec-independent protein translocase protein TatA
MTADIFATDGTVVLMTAAVVLFGGSQLPKLAKDIGPASRGPRRAHQEANGEMDAAAHADSTGQIFPKLGGTATTAEIIEALDSRQ